VTECVIDVVVGFVSGRSTVNLVVSQWFHWNTLRVTECDLKVHQTTASLEVTSLYIRMATLQTVLY